MPASKRLKAAQAVSGVGSTMSETSSPASFSLLATMSDTPGSLLEASPAETDSSVHNSSSSTTILPPFNVTIIPRSTHKPKPAKVFKSRAKPRSEHQSRSRQSNQTYRMKSRSLQDQLETLNRQYLDKREQVDQIGLWDLQPLIELPSKRSIHGRGPWRQNFIAKFEVAISWLDQRLGCSGPQDSLKNWSMAPPTPLNECGVGNIGEGGIAMRTPAPMPSSAEFTHVTQTPPDDGRNTLTLTDSPTSPLIGSIYVPSSSAPQTQGLNLDNTLNNADDLARQADEIMAEFFHLHPMLDDLTTDEDYSDPAWTAYPYAPSAQQPEISNTYRELPSTGHDFSLPHHNPDYLNQLESFSFDFDLGEESMGLGHGALDLETGH